MENDQIIIACATNDKKTFTGDHFGEAKLYKIFRFENGRFIFHTFIENIPFEEEKLGDPKKANHVKKLLKKKNVNMVANNVFGKNITKISKKFTAIVSRIENIDEALKKIDKEFLEKNKKNKICYLK